MARQTRRTGGASGGNSRRASGAPPGRRPLGRGSAGGAGPRASVRPGRSTARGSSAATGGRFAKSSTRRLAILATIFVMLALMLVPTLRGYLAQRAQIVALEEEVAMRQQEVDRLGRELQAWNDPAHVEQQARQRLKFVRPGETSYQVLDADGLTGASLAASGSVVRPNEAATSAWYGRVWNSLDAADSLSPSDVNAPLAPIAPDATNSAPETLDAPATSGAGPVSPTLGDRGAGSTPDGTGAGTEKSKGTSTRSDAVTPTTTGTQ